MPSAPPDKFRDNILIRPRSLRTAHNSVNFLLPPDIWCYQSELLTVSLNKQMQWYRQRLFDPGSHRSKCAGVISWPQPYSGQLSPIAVSLYPHDAALCAPDPPHKQKFGELYHLFVLAFIDINVLSINPFQAGPQTTAKFPSNRTFKQGKYNTK